MRLSRTKVTGLIRGFGNPCSKFEIIENFCPSGDILNIKVSFVMLSSGAIFSKSVKVLVMI